MAISHFFSSPFQYFSSDTIAKVYEWYRPYFDLSEENLKRTLGLFSIVLLSAIGSVLIVSVQNAFTALSIILMAPELTFSLIAFGALECLIPITLYSALFSISMSISSWISENLTFHLQHKLIQKYIDEKSYVGIKFISTKNKSKKINPSVILGEDLEQICSASLSLFTTFIQVFLNFIVGIYQLGVMSSPVTIRLFSLSIAVPGYMAIAAIFYAALYTKIVTSLDQNLKGIEKKSRSKKDNLSCHLHHIQEHPDSIALKNGSAKEKGKLFNTIDKSYAIQSVRRKINFFLNFLRNISSNVSYLFGLLLSVPGVIEGKVEGIHAFSLANYFTSVVNFFTWKKDNADAVINLDVSLERFNAFYGVMKEWDRIREENQLKITQKRNLFCFKNLAVKKPTGAPLFDTVSLVLPVGKAIVLQGSSGIGKTTLFRCLAGLWPYVKGEIILPKNNASEEVKIYYIPQKPYFPHRGTLIEAICYPNEKELTPSERKTVVKLMRDLDLPQSAIANLDKKEKWEEILSPGQQQRIAVIGAILKKPDLLFIDEGTNGLDLETKHSVHDALKKHLKKTTIVAIDHQSEPDNKPFYDFKLKMGKSQNNLHTTLQLQKIHQQKNQPQRQSERIKNQQSKRIKLA